MSGPRRSQISTVPRLSRTGSAAVARSRRCCLGSVGPLVILVGGWTVALNLISKFRGRCSTLGILIIVVVDVVE